MICRSDSNGAGSSFVSALCSFCYGHCARFRLRRRNRPSRLRVPVRRVLLCAFVSLLLLSAGSSTLKAETLQSVFDAATASYGYDRYVELQLGQTVTGGLAIPLGTSACIKGNGAILDLQTSMIQIQGTDTALDMDHCVVINGGNPAAGLGGAALNFLGGKGNIIGNTFYGNSVCIRIYNTVPGLIVVKNNIMALNTHAGLLAQQYHEPQVLYNDCWGNPYGNYLQDCG